MSGITLRTGTEGPRLDPYAFDEITVRIRRRKPVTVHIGLGIWMRIGSRRLQEHDQSKVAAIFERKTGMSIVAAKRALRKSVDAKQRQHARHGGMEWSRGYPGETFLMCRCGEVVDYHVNRSAIK